MANNPRIDIGVRVDYKDVLKQMKSNFKNELTEISNHAQKTSFDANIEKKLKRIDDKVDSVFGGLEKRLDELSNQTVSADNFEKYQKEATDALASVKRSVSLVKEDIAGLRTEVGMLNGADFASSMKTQFDDLTESMSSSIGELGKFLGLVDRINNGESPNIVDVDALKQIEIYKDVLEKIKGSKSSLYSNDNIDIDKQKKYLDLLKKTNSEESSGADALKSKMSWHEQRLAKSIANVKLYNSQLKEFQESDVKTPEYLRIQGEMMKAAASAVEAQTAIKAIDAALESALSRGMITDEEYGGMSLFTEKSLDTAERYRGVLKKYIATAEATIETNKEAANGFEQITTSVKNFYFKDGAVQIPIDIMSGSQITDKLNKALSEIQTYMDSHPVYAEVKLVAGTKKAGRKTNEEIADQLDTDKNPIDLGGSVRKAYRDALKEVESEANKMIDTVTSAFKNSKIPIHLDDKSFVEELQTVVNSSLRKIAEDATGLNVNSELEKLITNLKEVSTSLSGNENFKFGLDEATIERITTAIRDMADMIQRAFGVASNDDIAAQWATIESKFKGVAGEEGKLLKGNKEHKIAIQELAVEYKKYLDMGGTNDLSGLTKHTQTVKNITKEYEKLTAEAKEAQDILDQNIIPKNTDVNLTPNAETFRADAEKLLDAINLEKEINLVYSGNIKDTTKKNEKLETQADRTSVAIKGEGDSAQTAAGKFRKLAKEKGAAVVANRELAKAAKETTDALEREAKARKSGAGKPNKNAIDNGVYSSNYLKWQSDIEESLRNSGDYAEIYEAKVSQAINGTVKFTATVRDLDGALRKFSAGVNNSGEIFSPSAPKMSEKQSAEFEKKLIIAEKIREAIANMDSESTEPIRLNREQLVQYVDDIQNVLQGLEKLDVQSKATYKLDLNSDGKLSITRKEISETGAEVKTFTAVIENVDDIFEKTTEGIKVSSEKIREALDGAFDSGRVSKSTKDFISKAQDAFDKFTLKHKGNSNWSQIAEDMREIEQRIAGINSKKGLDEFKQDLSDIALKLNNIGKNNKLGEFLDKNRTFSNINEVRASIDSLFASMGKVNEKSIRVTGTDMLTAEVKAANGEIRKMTVSLDSDGFARYVDAGIVQFGRLRAAAEGVFKGIKQMARIYLSPYDFIRYFRQGFDRVKEIDVSMTELRKVSDATPGELASYFDDAVVSAKNLGSSVNNMISATADWSRMGYNLPDSKKLGEVAVLYKNVGDGIDIEEANSSLVSTLQGFQMEASEAERIVDSFNEVSNNFAISSGGIGEALKRSAAAFNAANTDMNQAIALITAGNEVVQNPEKVGTMWQTVSARIRGTKSELEALGEETDNVISTSKLRDLVMGYTKVDIMEDKNTYKDMYTIIREIGEVWGKLNDIDRAALLEALAGKKQSNTLAAVLNNYERLEKIYQTAEGSAGSAIKEQEKYKDSLGYSLDQLTAHGEDFWRTFINKDDVKDFIDLINILISSATKLVDTFGSIPTVAGILGGFAAIKNVGRPKTFGLKILF